MSPEDQAKSEKDDAQMRGAGNVVDKDNPGSEFETREVPMLKDKPDVPGSAPDSTEGANDSRSHGAESVDGTRKVQRTASDSPDEFDSGVVSPRAGSDADTVAMAYDDLDESEDETVIATRLRDDGDNLETREMPGLRAEWRERAQQAAEALGESAEVTGEWGDEADASLAQSVAAASGELPVPEEERPKAIAGSALELARDAQHAWAALTFEKRMPHFRALQNELVAQRADYVPSMATAIGRPMVETLAGEYIPVLEALRGIEDLFSPLLTHWHAGAAPLAADGLAASVHMAPWGVVAINHPAIAPFAYPMTLAIDALAAGNAIIICAAEKHPRVNEMMRKLFHRAGFPEHLVQIVGGSTESLLAVVDAAPDKVILYGEQDLAPRIAARCAVVGAEFQPVLPGKDILAVLPNAPLDRAVHAAMWGAFAAGGMLPASVERVVVAQPIYDEFRMNFIDAVRAMNSHHAQLANLDECLDPRRFQMLIDDAVAGGARVTWPAGESPGRWIHWKAAILENLADQAKLSVERSEGPAVALYRADDVESEITRLMTIAPASSLAILGEPTREQRARFDTMPVARLIYQDVFPAGASGTVWPVGPELPRNLCGPLSMLRPKVIAEGDPVAGRVAWFPYTDDKAYALMDAIEATYGLQGGKRIRAAVKLALNPQKRRLLRGENA